LPPWKTGGVRITHRVDYGVRVMVALALAAEEQPGVSVPSETLAAREDIPAKFLDDILRDLRTRGLTRSRRGPEGGWTLGRAAGDITVAEVIRVLEGPLASVRGIRPHQLPDAGGREPFVSLWVAVRAALRSVLDHVTVADLAAGKLPDDVAALLDAPGAWSER
jgi:Rrf2 family protein